MSDYGTALADIEEAYKEGLRAFAKWFAANWKNDPETWVKEYEEAPPPQAWFEGWNAAVEATEGAVEMFLEEHG